MSSLFSIGVSGLNAAQLGLKVTGNNIANAGTDGYSRQNTVQVDRVGQNNGRYTMGAGVDVIAVQRAYSQYLTQTLWNTNSALQGATATNDLATTLNGLLKNSGNLQSALDSFYGGFDAVANAPRDPAARQALLGNASTLAAAFNTFGQQLDQQRTQINTQIADAVGSINSLAKQIAALNTSISQAGDTQPNALLDQRDGLVKQLAGVTGISVAAQPDGTLSVYSSSGQALVSGSYAYDFQVGSDAYDASSTTVLDASGHDIGARLSGGTLGALLGYRRNTLDPAQNQLGRAALALAQSVNAQQAKGLDLNGNQGGPLFSVPGPAVAAAAGNQGSAAVGASVSDITGLTNDNYVLTYTGSATAPSVNGWALATSSGRSVAMTANPDGSLSAEGLTFTVSAGAQAGDSFQIRPTRDAASGLALASSDPATIAAAAALKGTAAAANSGGATVSAVGVTDSANANLFAGATVTFGAGGSYTVTDGAGNSTTGTYTSGTPIQFDGWSLSLAGTPASGDSFSVAKNSSGLNDNGNALDLAGLADVGVLDGGHTSVVGAYAGLTNQIGLAGSMAANDLTTQTGLYNQAASAQQSVAGVNLDEEAASLIKYQQAYQASAQVIATAQTLFTSLIAAIHG
ncbi:flagellar hook-associated protein FlgK [Rhodanobacter aciditrophus]|uniref:flagellar hook-associated protein FlgK n=1 Tax=Rhodanobacter aciditrophus TaxID=1623218 RepID=UPI003CE701FA